jgi:hypothetical protein
VDPERLEAIKSATLGFMHQTPKEMLDHLKAGGSTVDNDNVAELTTKHTKP